MSARLQPTRSSRRGGYIEPYFAGRALPSRRPRLAQRLTHALGSPLSLVLLPLVAAAIIALLS